MMQQNGEGSLREINMFNRFIKLMLVLGVLAALFIIALVIAFEPEYDKAEIKQHIGGVLICESVYTADHHKGSHLVTYTYKKPNGAIDSLGHGIYFNRIWKKDEQLIKYKSWLILKTGGYLRTDKLILINTTNNKKTELILEPDSIEINKLWQSKGIHSLLYYCCAEAYIQKIDTGVIKVKYKFRIDEADADKYDKRNIYYKIDTITGIPAMVKIE